MRSVRGSLPSSARESERDVTMSAVRIHIMGAAGSGTTTLGRALGQVLPHRHLDTDDYFWKEKFTKQRPDPARVELLRVALRQTPWVLSGGVAGWANELIPLFDLVVFLWIPQEIRMQRLQQRELERYGDAAAPGGKLYEQSQTFLKWAASYDTSTSETRSKLNHERWLGGLDCQVLRLEGDLSVPSRVDAVTNYLAAT